MPEPQKPPPYVVYWPDWDKCDRIAKERGCLPEDVDPALFEQDRDFTTLAAARRFYRTVEARGAILEQRVNYRERRDPPLRWWEWDQEPVAVEEG